MHEGWNKEQTATIMIKCGGGHVKVWCSFPCVLGGPAGPGVEEKAPQQRCPCGSKRMSF